MIAFHGKQEIKDTYLARVRAHRAADQIIKGVYWQHGKGCAVGCTIHSDNHAAYETELGIPRVLARLEDGIFEGLPNVHAKEWPEKFLDAIPVGADLSLVWPRFAAWLLSDPEHGVIRFSQEQDKSALLAVVDGYKRQIAGNPPSRDEWYRIWKEAREVRYAAAAAYASFAYAASAAAAADAYAEAAYAYAYAAAEAAAEAAAYATYAAAAYAAAQRQAARIAQSEMLLRLLSEAPVMGEKP